MACGIRWMEAVAITVSIASMLSSVMYSYIYVRGQQATIFNEIHNEYASPDIMEAFDTLEHFLSATGHEKYAEEYMRLKRLPREEYLKGKETGMPNVLASLFSSSVKSNSAVTTDAELGRRLDLSRRRLLHYLGKLLMFNSWGYLTDTMMHEFPGRARAMHAIHLLQPLVTHTARAYNFEDHQRVLDGIQAIYNISIDPAEPARTNKEFTVKLSAYPRGNPLVFIGGDWRPICGHWFWNTNDGATTVCQSVGYTTGVVHKISSQLNASAVLIGACKAEEPLGSCTGHMSLLSAIYFALLSKEISICQRNSVGCGSCSWGNFAGIEVECTGESECPMNAPGECGRASASATVGSVSEAFKQDAVSSAASAEAPSQAGVQPDKAPFEASQ